jgi:hypothetical protein
MDEGEESVRRKRTESGAVAVMKKGVPHSNGQLKYE